MIDVRSPDKVTRGRCHGLSPSRDVPDCRCRPGPYLSTYSSSFVLLHARDFPESHLGPSSLRPSPGRPAGVPAGCGCAACLSLRGSLRIPVNCRSPAVVVDCVRYVCSLKAAALAVTGVSRRSRAFPSIKPKPRRLRPIILGEEMHGFPVLDCLD